MTSAMLVSVRTPNRTVVVIYHIASQIARSRPKVFWHVGRRFSGVWPVSIRRVLIGLQCIVCLICDPPTDPCPYQPADHRSRTWPYQRAEFSAFDGTGYRVRSTRIGKADRITADICIYSLWTKWTTT